jgi:hypothetical protein
MEEVIDKILELMRAKRYPEVVGYYFGDPITYPQFDLPAIAVSPSSDSATAYTTAKDVRLLGVTIFIVRTARDGYNPAKQESPVDRFLIHTAEDVIATLRENITLDGRVATCDSCSVQYVPAIRGREAVRLAQIEAVFRMNKSR